MSGHVRFVSLLCAAALSTAAFAQEPPSSEELGTDVFRQPDGLYDATPHTRAPEASAWIVFNWWPLEVGISGRYFHPLLPDGFLDELNDSFEVGSGLDFFPLVFSAFGGMELDVPVEARWTFHLMPKLAVYGKISLGLTIKFGGTSAMDFWNAAGPGVIYQLSDKMTVQAELTYRGLRGGVAFLF
jgi:hypothetical protein